MEATQVMQMTELNSQMVRKIQTDRLLLHKVQATLRELSSQHHTDIRKQKEIVRALYIAEGRVTKVPPKKKPSRHCQGTDKQSSVEKQIQHLPEHKQDEMLQRLLAIRAARQMK